MIYVILSMNGLGFFLVPRLNKVKEIEKIYFCLQNPDMKHYGKGLNQLPDYSKLEVIQDYNYALNKHTKEQVLIVIDDVGMGETGAALRKLGYKVVGGGVMADRLERERTLATNLMKKVMNVPETFTFTTFEGGMMFLKTQDKSSRFVFKPNDEDVPKEYTYVAKDVQDMIDSMKQFKSEWKWKEDFQLQRLVEGFEVDFNGYFNGKDFLGMMIYFENKPLMNDDIGPATGGAIAVQLYRDFKGKFADILDKLKPIFIRDGYVGCIAINSIVSQEDHEPYFLEFTNRFGYPSLPLDITLLEDNGKTVHDLFTVLVTGKTTPLFAKKVAVEVSVSAPSYPSKNAESLKGLEMSWDKKWDAYFFPYFIMKGDKNNIVLAGINSECLNVTCVDDTIDGATQMLYETYMPTLRLKGALYRTDVGKDAKRRLKGIKDYGLF